MDDDDLDFDLSKSRSAKQGRRAQQHAAPPEAPSFETTEELKPSQRPNSGDRPPKSSRVSGWGESVPRKKGRNLGEGFEQIEDERLRPRSPEDDSDTDIPVIPDLDDTQDDDMSAKVAIAPNIQVNRVATFRELDNDLLKQAAFLTLDNEIDLKVLTKSLSTDADLVEEDKPWEWDRLFTEVTSELMTQWEKEQEEESEQTDQT
ncbi:hypothetical protein ScPMuIL_013817 [Solemya velum]